ncbi:MAG: DUF899 family protein [Planctomycetales bacterium]
MAEEKELTRRRDAVAKKVRDLPWVKVEKDYTFDGPTAKLSLISVWREEPVGRVSLRISTRLLVAGMQVLLLHRRHYNGIVVHLAIRDISFMTVSKTPHQTD